MINPYYLYTDVTCVESFNNCIAAGVGDFFNTYDLHTNSLIYQDTIFEGQNIFGIKPNANASKLILYGGKRLCIKSRGSRCIHLLSDWVLDAKWIDDEAKIVTVFMHNKITVWSAGKDFTSLISVKCEERCILYSAHICYDRYEQLLILSGTVFGEVLLWKPFYTNKHGEAPVLKRLKRHKGVIFSIDCNLENNLICSVSDDRSAVLWKMTATPDLLNPASASTFEIGVACQVFGHLSRVFRCLILKDFFVTAGEDSLVIMWDFEGSMLRKIDSHQGGPVWSLCFIESTGSVCTGGNDGGISTFKAKPKCIKTAIASPDTPKIVGLLKSSSMICWSEKAALYHRTAGAWKLVATHEDLEKYCIVQISPCKRLVALAGYEGQVYIYQETTGGILKFLLQHRFQNPSRIFSLHWISCKVFLISQNDGLVTLSFIYKEMIYKAQTFTLPPSKERWPTCACLTDDRHVIIGDRKGNVHNFKIGHPMVINTLKKAHSYLGVTNLHYRDGAVVSLGKDGSVKTYRLQGGYLECVSSHKTKFSWLTALENDCLLSFAGDNLVISHFESQRILFQTLCGGGHRSWDYLKVFDNVTLAFIKQKTIHTIEFNLQDFTPKDIVEGYHAYEINCLKVLSINNNYLIVSGGEDTFLRLSASQVLNIKVLQCLKVHLSSIRAIGVEFLTKTSEDWEYLLISAGGRGQIISWHLMVKSKGPKDLKVVCEEKCNYYVPLDHQEAETRIMDLAITTIDGEKFLFAASSDGLIKIFSIGADMNLIFLKAVSRSQHSLTKLAIIPIPGVELLASMATDGFVTFWSTSDICNHHNSPLSAFKIHQSGVTSCSYNLRPNSLLLLTGGDDSCVTLTQFALDKTEHSTVMSITNSLQDLGLHCAQITGSYMDDNFFITSSIDQKVVFTRWSCAEQMKFQGVGTYPITIADAKGLEVVGDGDYLNLYIYGNGVEHVEIQWPKCREL